MKSFSSKEIRFSGNLIKSCVCFIDLVDSTKNTITMDNLEHIRIYYSKFINSVSKIVKSYGGKVIKNIGDCLLAYFPKTSDNKSEEVFREAIECSFQIIDVRYIINQELSKQHLPPFSYRITLDYGVLDLALVGEYNLIDLFGSTINICSKINSSISITNQIIVGENFYRILKSFSNIANTYNFINNGECKITETFGYSTYSIKKVNKLLIDDSYEIISFINPSDALNYIKDLTSFDNLLVTLDIRMKNLNGFQLHQQIKAIDPTIKIIFITALDILDELISIVPGISKEQIMRKPVDKKIFTNTVKNLLR